MRAKKFRIVRKHFIFTFTHFHATKNRRIEKQSHSRDKYSQ